MKNKKNMKTNNQENEINLFENVLGKNILKIADQSQEDVEVISTGSIGLDQALGIGGYPVGKIIEIYGNESSGKTTICLQAIKEAQKQNKRCLFIDVENSLDIKYANNIGIDTSKLLVAHPNSGEQVFDIIELLIKSDKVDFIVVDSVAAMIPLAEIDANYDEQQMGLHARLMSKGMRKLQSILIHHECTVIFINQIREKIGVFFGNPETTTGGKALKFFSSIRLETRKADLIKDDNNKIGIQAKVTVVKNKLAPPLKNAFIDIYFDNGFNYNNEIIEFAIKYDVIKKSGSWFYYQEQKLGQGREQLKKYLNDNNEIFEQIKNETINHLN